MDQKTISKQNRKEMQEKVNKQYIDQKINLIIEPMAAALFTTGGGQDPVSKRIRILLTFHTLDWVHAWICKDQLRKQTFGEWRWEDGTWIPEVRGDEAQVRSLRKQKCFAKWIAFNCWRGAL